MVELGSVAIGDPCSQSFRLGADRRRVPACWKNWLRHSVEKAGALHVSSKPSPRSVLSSCRSGPSGKKKKRAPALRPVFLCWTLDRHRTSNRGSDLEVCFCGVEISKDWPPPPIRIGLMAAEAIVGAAIDAVTRPDASSRANREYRFFMDALLIFGNTVTCRARKRGTC